MHAGHALSNAANSMEAFIALLRKDYGSLLRAWRLCLDTSGDNKLSFVEFKRWCTQAF